MTKPPASRWKLMVARLGRGVLGAIFLVAAALKAIDPSGFASQIESYGWLPTTWVHAAALFFITTEVLLGTALVVNLLPRLASLGTGLLLLGFMVVLTEAWYNGKTVDCGCFGANTGVGPGEGALRDVAFLFLLVPTLIWGARPSRGPWRMGAVAVSVLLGLGLSLAAPSLPLDALLTDLAPGARVPDLGMEALVPEQGAVLVALLDLDAEPSRAAVAKLNELTQEFLDAEVMSFAAEGADERFVFGIEQGALFPVEEIGAGTLGRLSRRLPRFALLQDGEVTAVWNDQAPDPESLRSALGGGTL